MNGDRTFGKAIPNEDLSKVMRQISKWWLKWKAAKITENSFMEAWAEIDDITRNYMSYPMVRHLYLSFIYELDARLYGGYTEMTRTKLLSIIREESYGT